MDYDAYLRSDDWRTRKSAIMVRAEQRCEVPGCDMPAVDVHHLTYDRLGDEKPEDLAAICLRCHAVLHDPETKFMLPCMGEDYVQARELLAMRANRIIREAIGGEQDGSKLAGLSKRLKKQRQRD